MPDEMPSEMPDARQRLRRFVYLLVIAVAGAHALASIMTVTLLYSPRSESVV